MPKKITDQIKIPDRYKEGEADDINRHWRVFFLDKLAETSNVSAAARFAGVNPARAYKLRRNSTSFAKQWHAALLEGYEHLEMETLKRLRKGTKPDGRKFDIANALRLLALHRENVAQAKAAQHNVSAAEVRESIDRKVEKIRLQVIADKQASADN